MEILSVLLFPLMCIETNRKKIHVPFLSLLVKHESYEVEVHPSLSPNQSDTNFQEVKKKKIGCQKE